jgi:hypothetical protein
MVRKQPRSGTLLLCLLLTAWPLVGLEKTIELGKEQAWSAMKTMDGLARAPGKWGFQDLVLAGGEYVVDSATECLFHFNAVPATDAAAAYRASATGPAIASQVAAMGAGSAAFTGSRSGSAFAPPPDGMFAAGAAWGDFTVEFWLYPATISNGESILSWSGSTGAAKDAARISQTLGFILKDRRLVWEFQNIFQLPGGARVPVSLTGTRQLLPRAWHHHLLRFDARTGLLEYLLDGVPEAIVHVTDTGRETGSIAVPVLGAANAGPLVLGAGFTGFLDELRISRRFVEDPVLERFLGRTGTAVSQVFDLGFSSTRIARIEAVSATPSDTSVEYAYQVANTWIGNPMLGPDTAWVPFVPGTDFKEKLKGRYLQLRVELFPDGSRAQTPRLSSLNVVYEPNVPPAPPAGLAATPGNGKVTLTWRKVNDLAVKGYRVYYGDAPQRYLGTGAAQGDAPLDAGAATSIEISGLENGTLYYFAVTAYDGSDPRQESQFSAEKSARPSRIYP